MSSLESKRLALFFSSAGHFCVHMFTAIFFVVVLSLESEWGLPYDELIGLWTVGALMVGVAALPAGWLSDRFGAPVLMTAYFLGLGGCSVVAGLADSPPALMLSLTALGVCAAVYHPVGIPWMVRNARAGHKGKALAFNGIFGSLGSAGSGLITAVMIDFAGWRSAFVLPGAVCLGLGVFMAWFVSSGRLVDGRSATETPPSAGGGRHGLGFALLIAPMFLGGLVYQTTQAALPKIITVRVESLFQDGALGIGLALSVIYALSGLMQLVAGRLADRYPPQNVYLATWMLQVPLLAAAALAGGPLFLFVAVLMVVANIASLPAENMLLARYAPERRHGLAFGAKFVLTFGSAPLAVQLIASVFAATGAFVWVIAVLSAAAAVAAVCAAILANFERGAADAAKTCP